MQEIAHSISFAPIGLLDMFNSSGAVEKFDITLAAENSEQFDGNVASELSNALSDNRSPSATITLTVRGCGRFGAYSSQRPLKCTIDSVDMKFNYNTATGLVTLAIPVPDQEMYRWSIEIQV